MKTSNLMLLAGFILSVFSSCKKDPEPIPVQLVKAAAGADQAVPVNTLVTLDGSASALGSGKTLVYTWGFKSKPSASAAALQNPATASATFTPDAPGAYVVQLSVSDGKSNATDELTVTASAKPIVPTAVFISADITEDRMLADIFTDPAAADYKVTANINVGAKLTIAPGVVIEFEPEKGFTILPAGALVAKGTATRRIVFTGREKTNGFWRGIAVASNNTLNELEYAEVNFAGSSQIYPIPVDLKASVALIATSSTSAASLKINHSIVANGGGYGLFVHGQSELKSFLDNTFTGNQGGAISVPARQVHKLDAASRFSGGNGANGVEIRGTLHESAAVTWPVFADGSPYLVTGDLSLESGLTLSEGAVLNFYPGVALQVVNGGSLNATGTAAKPVVFTAHTKTTNGYWGGILFNTTNELNKLQNCEISWAGAKVMPGFTDLHASVAVGTAGKATIRNTTVKHGPGFGIVAFRDKGAQLNDDVLSANTFEGLVQGQGRLTSGEVTLSQLAGEWVDAWTFTRGYAIDEKFYDRTTNRWFRGAAEPWTMNQGGFGLKIAANGDYIWTIAERGPVLGCGSIYNAEFITGKVTEANAQLTFVQNYWRTKFYNACNLSLNADIEVQTGTDVLRYELYEELRNGQKNWVLEMFNPGGTSFKMYRRTLN